MAFAGRWLSPQRGRRAERALTWELQVIRAGRPRRSTPTKLDAAPGELAGPAVFGTGTGTGVHSQTSLVARALFFQVVSSTA